MTAPPVSRSPGTESSSKSSSPVSNIAFLVHSPHTLTQNLPPDVDNKSFARQRRRRTRYVLLYVSLFASNFLLTRGIRVNYRVMRRVDLIHTIPKLYTALLPETD